MMAGGQVMGITAMGQCLFIGRRVCIRLRAIIVAEVFTKALRRQDLAGSVKNASKPKMDADGKPLPAPSAEAEAEADTTGASDGKIANHVSVDAFAISEICAYIFYIASCPLAIVVNSFFLYQNLGVASFAGIAVLVLMIPVQGATSRLYTTVQKRFMEATDARLDSVTEIISHVKLIKFNAWETKFFDRMADKRRHELKMLAQRFAVNVMFQVVIWGTPLLVTACAFAVHVLVLKKPLKADTAFSSLILFNMLRDPLGLFQDTLTRLLQAYTSCTRIQAFLDEPDTKKYQQLSRPGRGDPEIGFRNAMVGYSSAADIEQAEFEPFQLGPLDLSFPIGQLSVVVGSVGSGKTTLIQSLLGETTLLEGKIFMPDDHANREICPIDPITGLSDTVAYCAQSAWLVGASIKDNIVFGSAWDKKRYNAVVQACALKKDFEIFDLGDETEVGEKGTTCSGGQKARIALARALYSPARTILLDDVLSAVDAQTARHLHVHCLLGPLMKNRTVIMVTHQVNLVAPSSAYVVSLHDGQVVAAGTPSELVASGDLEISEDEIERSDTPTSSTLGDSDEPVDIIEENLDGIEHDALDGKKKADADEAAPEAVKLAKQLVATELQGQGVIKFSTYMLYFKSMGGLFFWVILGVAFGGAQLLQIASNAWIKDWANANDPGTHQDSSTITSFLAIVSEPEMSTRTYLLTRSTQFYLGVYVAITGFFLVGVAARFGIGYIGSLRASAKLYDKLLKRILGAKMRFFDSTPSGRIINRLSKDMSSIDTEAGESEFLV
jgi:ABC-type multidrug transport system fused ATPase/permease subunit